MNQASGSDDCFCGCYVDDQSHFISYLYLIQFRLISREVSNLRSWSLFISVYLCQL